MNANSVKVGAAVRICILYNVKMNATVVNKTLIRADPKAYNTKNFYTYDFRLSDADIKVVQDHQAKYNSRYYKASIAVLPGNIITVEQSYRDNAYWRGAPLDSKCILHKLNADGTPDLTASQIATGKRRVMKALSDQEREEKFTELSNTLTILGIEHQAWNNVKKPQIVITGWDSLTELEKAMSPAYKEEIKDMFA